MTVVFKLGGSLLSLKGLAEKLPVVFEQRPAQPHLIVSGGGESANTVRNWSRVHNLCDENAHWLAISSIDFNCRLLEKLFQFKSVSSRQTAQSLWSSERLPLLLNLGEFVAAEEEAGTERMPHDWSVTSDSLAAWTAVCWPAEELILLKSVPLPVGLTAEGAAHKGLVDDYFPMIANRLNRVGWCNLRDTKIVVEPWLSNPVDFSEKAKSEL